MQITEKDWKKYINQMAKISQTAADRMQDWVDKHGFSDNKALLDYAYALAAHYGEAIGALSCQMYEATAAAQGVIVKTAEAAATPEYGEVAKAVNGAKKQSEKLVPSTVGRLVKQVGADTTLKNAERDGAQFAWVPHGDTCAFCLTLASRGWQYMSKKALKNGHAEHIHANCDCEYAVRFDSSSTVEGYDPDKYLEIYNNAEGNTPQEKINSMRRTMAAQTKAVAESKKSGIIKAITLDDIEAADSSGSISAECKERIINVIKEQSAKGGFYYDRVKVVNISRNKDGGIEVLRTNAISSGNYCETVLEINEVALNGKSKVEIDNMFFGAQNTVCNSLEDAVIHEIGHAKIINDRTYANYERINEELKFVHKTGVSELAESDGLECVAECEVLLNRGKTLSDELMKFYKTYTTGGG